MRKSGHGMRHESGSDGVEVVKAKLAYRRCPRGTKAHRCHQTSAGSIGKLALARLRQAGA
jgi:hypothetical protein